jgi:tetratricopeptide (TPR) repeat protein
MNGSSQLQQALQQFNENDLQGAVISCHLVLASEADNFDALFICGIAQLRMGREAEALESLEAALAIKPSHFDALGAYGHLLLRNGRIKEAIRAFEKATAVSPGSADALNNLGDALSRAGRHDEALSQFSKALSFKPDDFVTHYNRGVALGALQRPQEAIAAFTKALHLKPDHAQAANNIALIYSQLGRASDALTFFKQAVELRPSYVLAWINLGRLLYGSGDADEAIQCLDRAVAMEPRNTEAQYEYGLALMHVGRPKAAIERFEKALDLDSNHLDAGFNLSLARLLVRDYANAWPLYDLRLQTLKELGGSSRVLVDPGIRHLKNPSELHGGPLLVLGEQGLGDEIMFASVLPEILRVVPDTTLTADPRLVGLFERSFPGLTVVPHPPDDRGAVNAIPGRRRYFLGSLMKLFRNRLDCFPGSSYLVADHTKREKMRARVTQLGRGAKIGIMWRGGVGGQREGLRSLSLAELLVPLQGGGRHWISLSHLPAADRETAAYTESFGTPVHHWPDVLRSDDYDDTAALIRELDLVVSVTGTVAHCAAALGVPTHVLVNRIPEWRYGQTGAATPWYSAMTLYRKGKEWPFEALAHAVDQAVEELT